MKVIVDLCVVPMGTAPSVSRYVAACAELIRRSGLKHRMHAYGTCIEGDWDAVMAVARQCHETLHEMGVPRIFTTLKIGTRTDHDQTMEEKLAAAEEKIGTVLE